MQEFTLITPKSVYRVKGRSYAQIELAAIACGMKVLGIHRDGDTGFYDPTPAPHRGSRDTAFSRAFQGVAA